MMKRLARSAGGLLRWETMLIAALVVMCAVFDRQDAARQVAGLAKKDVFNPAVVIKGLRPYMLYSFMTLGIMLILAMGDIDISTGASAALSVAALGVVYQALTGAGIPGGLSLALSLAVCLLTGWLCGAVNGWLVTRFKELFAMIITLATQLFYRGVAYLLLGGKTLTFKNDAAFDLLKRLYNTVQIGDVSLPVMLIAFLAAAACYAVWVHGTAGGRRVFALGTNPKATLYSGIRADRVKFRLFALCGLTGAVTGVFFVGATSSSIRADAMMGYEMYAIAAAVLGGFSTSGGRGSVPGVVLSLVIFGVMKIGLGTLYGFADSMVNLSVGVILIVSTLLPNLLTAAGDALRLRKRRAQANVSSRALTSGSI
ncbi:MAG: ABC transporter permease [Oscillospiraceae bacterium]|jgi:rhamnose transport system permease protein|nr:ABC transporter permease [Oscillospiraceae bacterium]